LWASMRSGTKSSWRARVLAPGGLPGALFCEGIFTDRVTELRRRKALWKLTELWKNQKRVFPQLLEPSVHSFHNAGCCFLKHNFSSTPGRLDLAAGSGAPASATAGAGARAVGRPCR